MVRDRQKLLGRFVIETTDGHQQEIRVIGEGGRVTGDVVSVRMGPERLCRWNT